MFNSQPASIEEICTDGDKILVNLYNGKSEQSLKTIYVIKDSAKRLYPHKFYHQQLLRQNTVVYVFYQIQQWKSSMEKLDPEQWGWNKNVG